MRQMTIAIQILVLLMHISCTGARGSNPATPIPIDSLWQKEFGTAQDIVTNYTAIEKQIEGMPEALHTENLCHYIWQSGEYMFRCRGKNEDIALLPQNIREIRLDDETVAAFMTGHNCERFTDHYFTLLAMKRGDSFEESRDGITMTVFYPLRSMNNNDYAKMKEVFSCKNDALHTAYMKKLKFPFGNSGCNEEFYAVRPYIEKNVKESKLKNEIIALFDLYRNTMPGEQAPTPVLVDTEGNEHTFAEFKGKVLVIDVWATWCSSCLYTAEGEAPRDIRIPGRGLDRECGVGIVRQIERDAGRAKGKLEQAPEKAPLVRKFYAKHPVLYGGSMLGIPLSASNEPALPIL